MGGSRNLVSGGGWVGGGPDKVFYTANFEKVEGAYCFGLYSLSSISCLSLKTCVFVCVRACVRVRACVCARARVRVSKKI